MTNDSIRGKLRSNVRAVQSNLLNQVGHFSVTIRSADKTKPDVVENIYLTGKTWEFAQKHLKKGVIATIYYEYKTHEWIDQKTNQVKRDLFKFATYIKTPTEKPAFSN